MTKDEALRLALEALKNNRRTHHYCEDTWYSCPKHEDGCANDSEGDECNCGADKANAGIDQAITAIKAALEANDEPVAHSVVAGALFDFMGWLTSREKRLILSSVDEASPAVEAITEFAKKRNLSLKYAEVGYWTEFLSTPPQRKPLVFGLNDDGQFTFSVGVQTFTLDYFPENDEETEFMKRQLTHAIEAAHGIKGEA